jgi:hypothetical protein
MKDILLIALILANIIQAIIHYVERRDMLNRIMSKDLVEYKQSGNPPKQVPSAHDRTLSRWRNKGGDK